MRIYINRYSCDICGTILDDQDGLPIYQHLTQVGFRGENFHFCSIKCLENWIKNKKEEEWTPVN